MGPGLRLRRNRDDARGGSWTPLPHQPAQEGDGLDGGQEHGADDDHVEGAAGPGEKTARLGGVGEGEAQRCVLRRDS